MELPASPDIERLILGSVLLDGALMDSLRPTIADDDLLLDDHRRVWAAMCRVYDAGANVEIPSVGQDLRDHKQDQLRGGVLTFLIELTDGVPKGIGLDHHIGTLKEKARLRRIAAVAESIHKRTLSGLETSDELTAALGSALTDMQASGVESGPVSTREMIDRDGIDQLLQPRRTEGIRLPWNCLNDPLCGFHPGQMITVGAATGRGKTSFALQIATHATRQGKSPIIWTLEMSPRQNFVRMVNQLAFSDSDRARQDALTAPERGRRRDAAYWLHGHPVWFDKRSRTVPAFCASVRQAKAKSDVGLVIVDYLQLIRFAGRAESRTREVGENSRSLKLAAMELDLPFVVLSQFKRKNDERDYDINDLKECVTGDTRVIDADTGRMIEVRNLRDGQRVIAVDGNQRVASTRLERVWSTGIKEVFRLRTRTGRTIKATDNHPFLTAKGWRELGKLRVGDRIATAKWIFDHGSEVQENHSLCRLLGYLVGDGSYLNHASISFISADREVFEDAGAIVREHWPSMTHTPCEHPEGYYATYYTQLYENGYGKPHGNPLREWLRGLRIGGERDSEKCVPEFVFESGIQATCEFLAGYLATDGCVKFSKQYPRAEIQFDSTSRRLLEDVQLLLLKIGVVSTLNNGTWNTKSSKPIYRLTLSIIDENIRKFAAAVPVRGRKGECLKQILASAPKKETGGGLFNLPAEISELCWERSGGRKKGGWTHQGKTMRRSSAKQWAERHGDREVRMWATSDLLWEEIASIERAGTAEVFDYSVPGYANVVANGIVAHNSGDIENDSDVILIMNGPKMDGDRDIPIRVNIGKQREGPTGFDIPLTFHPPSQSFFAPEERSI